MDFDYRIADYQIAGPSPAPLYAPGRCCLCGEDAAVNEEDECEACVKARQEADDFAGCDVDLGALREEDYDNPRRAVATGGRGTVVCIGHASDPYLDRCYFGGHAPGRCDAASGTSPFHPHR